MKKIISILVLFAIATTAIFAQSEDNTIPSEDPIEENFVYKMNGKIPDLRGDPGSIQLEITARQRT